MIFNTNVNNEKYNPKVIVSIDFGTSGIDYCFAFNKPGNIDLTYCGLPGTEGTNCKSPSEIIICENYNTIKFGVECKNYISQIKEKEYYFKILKCIFMKIKQKYNPKILKKNF